MPKLPMCNFGLKNGLRFGLRLFFQLHSAPGQLALVKTFFFTDCGPQIVFHGKWGILTWYWIHKTKTKSYHYEHNLPQTVNIQGVFILAIICAVLRAQPLSYCWRGLGVRTMTNTSVPHRSPISEVIIPHMFIGSVSNQIKYETCLPRKKKEVDHGGSLIFCCPLNNCFSVAVNIREKAQCLSFPNDLWRERERA